LPFAPTRRLPGASTSPPPFRKTEWAPRLDEVAGLLAGAPDAALAQRVYCERGWLRVTPMVLSSPGGRPSRSRSSAGRTPPQLTPHAGPKPAPRRRLRLKNEPVRLLHGGGGAGEAGGVVGQYLHGRLGIACQEGRNAGWQRGLALRGVVLALRLDRPLPRIASLADDLLDAVRRQGLVTVLVAFGRDGFQHGVVPQVAPARSTTMVAISVSVSS
jgi:hypothetical protein